jgi:uncharacterized protein (DUF4415 family)
MATKRKRAGKPAAGRKTAKGRRTGRLRGVGEESSAGWLGKMEDLYKPLKKSVTLRLDADVLAWFKRDGRGYQTRINRALRGVMMKERRPGAKS